MIRARLIAVLLGSTGLLAGCSTLGGNIKGSFSCVAPDGICAPSGMIDDRALALISGEDGDRLITPAGPYSAPVKEGRGYQQAVAPERTRERVLRIVFPAQIDAAGRLHERSAVHAVVEQGEWQQALAANAVAATPRDVAAVLGGDTLLAAVERAEPVAIETAQTESDLPSEEAIVAARAAAAAKAGSAVKPGGKDAGQKQALVSDPVGDIKDQVARRLVGRPVVPPHRHPVSQVVTGVGKPSAVALAKPVTQAPTADAKRPEPAQSTDAAVETVRSGEAAIAVPQHATEAGKRAIAAIAANPAIRAGLARAPSEAKSAAQDADPLPVIRASSFPGVQP